MANVPQTRAPSLSFAVPLDVLARLQVLRYVIIACIAMCIWDWILALSDELRMVRRNYRQPRIGYVLSGVYYVSRVSMIGYLIACYYLAVFTPELKMLVLCAGAICNGLALPAASGLFYVRLSAIYVHNRMAMLLFGISWIAVFAYFIYDGAYVILKFASTGVVSRGQVPALAYILNLIYDTMVYLTISWRLAEFSITGDIWRDRARSFVTGEGLLGLTQALLRSGQVFYFTIIGFSAATVICLYSDDIPLEYKGLMLMPNMAVASIMACCLFRGLKLGILPYMSPEYELLTLVLSESPIDS